MERTSSVALKILRHVNFHEIPVAALDSSLETLDPYLHRKIMLQVQSTITSRDFGEAAPLINSRGMEMAIVKVSQKKIIKLIKKLKKNCRLVVLALGE